MGQKSNPISLRLEKTNQRWSSCWYADYNYVTQFLQDCRINAYFQNCNQQWKKIPPVLSLKHQRGEMQIALFSPRPILNPYPNRGGSRNRSRAPVRKGWDKEKRRKVQTLNAHFYTPSDIERRLFNLKLPAASKAEKKNAVWASARALLFASQLGIVYPQQLPQENTDSSVQGSVGVRFPLINSIESTLALLCERAASLPRGYAEEKIRFSNAKSFSVAFLANKNTQQLSTGLGGPLKKRLESSVATMNTMQSNIATYRCKIHIFKSLSTFQSPFFIASKLVFLLQERRTFRQLKLRLITELIQEIEKTAYIKGIRITCSGRVAARSKKAQKARTESIQWGETGLNVFSECVGFASKSAQTTYGKLGVKVWVCYSAQGIAL